MTRHAHEVVDAALERNDRRLELVWTPSGFVRIADVLDSEVRALREELGECEKEFRAPLRAELAELKTTLSALNKEIQNLYAEADVAAKTYETTCESYEFDISALTGERDAARTENAELRRQLVAARSALQQCTHERVDPNCDPFGGF